jgi:hypothetical protein
MLNNGRQHLHTRYRTLGDHLRIFLLSRCPLFIYKINRLDTALTKHSTHVLTD